MNSAEKYTSIMHECWQLAEVQENRKQSGLKRLRKFNILVRLLFSKRFFKIKQIIEKRQQVRQGLVITALGAARSARKERKRLVRSN